MAIDTVILAGALAGPEMSPQDPDISRAMLKIGEKTMLQWVVDALRASSSVGRIVAVGDVTADGLNELISPTDSFLDNIVLGVDACSGSDRVLVSTSDIPMITPEAVDDFVTRALESGGEMCYPIIPIEACEARYPGMKRTTLRLKEGTFTGGNMMVLSRDFLRRNSDTVKQAYAARKKPAALASMIGLGLLLRLPISQLLMPSLLPLDLLERKVSTMVGGRVVAVRSDYPEIGSDVDKPGDLVDARRLMSAA